MPNAYSSDQVRSKLGWSNSFDRNAAYPLDFASYFGSYEDAVAAAETAVEVGSTDSKYFYGQQLYVFDGTTATTYLIMGDRTLTEIGSTTSSTMLFVDTEDQLYLLTDIETGQQVLVEDTGVIWIFKGGTISEPTNWVESGSASTTNWDGTEDRVIFRAINSASFAALDPKDSNTLYFVTDTGHIYKGSTDMTQCITVGTIPDVSSAVVGRLYIDSASFAAQVTMDGSTWLTLSPGYLTDGVEWAAADSNKFATIGLIKKGIEAAVNNIDISTYLNENLESHLTGVAHDVEYDSSNLIITIPQYGGSAVTINLPKDKFVTAGQFYESYPEQDPQYTNVIVLTIDNQEEPVIIPASALVDVYTANNGDNDVVVAISDGNEISATVKIDPAQGNALVTSSSGLMVDVSDKIDKIVSASGGQVALTTSEGGVSESGFTIQSSGELGSESTVIPTANLVAAAIAAVAGTVGDLSTKVDKVSGTVDNFVGFATADGDIKDSGYKAGGSSLSDTPDASTLATEAAVSEAVSNAVTWGTIE